MPIYTHYNEERQRYEFTAVGHVRFQDFLDVQARMAADPDFERAMSVQGDLRYAFYQFNEQEMSLLAANNPDLLKGKQLTYLMSNGHKVGLMRQYLRRMNVGAAALIMAEGAEPIVEILSMVMGYLGPLKPIITSLLV